MSKEALIVGTARQGIFFIPIVFILPKLLGMNGVLYTQALSDLFTVILTAYFAYKTNEMLKLKNEQDKHIKTNTIEVL
jgi:Na+-driven multidrug efflux pump